MSCRLQSNDSRMLRCREKQWPDYLSSISKSMQKQEWVCVLGCISSDWSCKYSLGKEIICSRVWVWCIPLWYPSPSSALIEYTSDYLIMHVMFTILYHCTESIKLSLFWWAWKCNTKIPNCSYTHFLVWYQDLKFYVLPFSISIKSCLISHDCYDQHEYTVWSVNRPG